MGLSERAPTTEPGSPAEPEDPAPPSLGDPPGPIGPADTFADAARKAMWPHVERLLRFEPFLADPARTDELKRYRVATRRLRSALRLFAPAFPRRDVSSMRDALGDVGRAAGLVRDLDVRLADLKAWAVSDGGETLTEVGPLREAWQAERASLSVALLERLEARRHPRLIRELVDLVEGRTGATAVGGRALRDSAASRLWAAYEELRTAGALLPWADLPAMHEVRIDAKRLRYALEFLGDALPPTRTLLIQRLVELQDHLGAINDAAVIAAAVGAVLTDSRITMQPAERATIARYAADRDRDLARLRRGVGPPWRQIASTAFARRLGRTVVVG